MDPLIGAAVAGATGAASILLAALVPLRRANARVLRIGGAASLAATALLAFGLPVPVWVPLAMLGASVGAAYAVGPAPADGAVGRAEAAERQR